MCVHGDGDDGSEEGDDDVSVGIAFAGVCDVCMCGCVLWVDDPFGVVRC